MSEPQRNIVYVLHWGDLTSTVRMLTAAKVIREMHRRDRIILLTTPDYESLLKHCPYFNAIEIDARPDARPLVGVRDKRLKVMKASRVYDLVGDNESKKVRKAFRAKRDAVIEVVARDPGQHPVDELGARLNTIFGTGPGLYPLGAAPAPDASWVDYLAKKSRMLDPEYFGLNGPFALLAPAGETVKASLRWPKEKWAALAHELLQAGITPAVVGGPDTREIGRHICHVSPGARDLTGKAKLPQLAGLARRTNFVFAEDTDLAHLLVAGGPPSLVLFAQAEDPVLRAPRGNAPVILMHAATLAQVDPREAMAAMKFAGGFEPVAEPA